MSGDNERGEQHDRENCKHAAAIAVVHFRAFLADALRVG
jgi:hypothetical protein